MLPRKEVIRRLRERAQPIRLFGETDEDSFNRLKHLEISDPDIASGSGCNDFKAALDKVNEEISKSCETTNESSSKVDVNITGLSATMDEMKASILELNSDSGDRNDEEAKATDCEVIAKFLKFIMESWGLHLNSRPIDEKTSQEGKNVSARYTTTRAHLKPLFKLLKNNKISNDVLYHLKIISKNLVEKEYRDANSQYLKLSIGNAAWPIGVTMVGIHARTGREKISQSNIAHALNDEVQRKYIQGIKRLITQFTNMFPADSSQRF